MNRVLTVFLAGLVFSFTATACSGVDSENAKTPKADHSVVATGEGSNNESSKPEFLTVETFKAKIWNYEKNPQEWVYEGSEPAIIDFYANWCKPCKMVAPILEEISNDYAGKVKVYKINTEEQKELASVFQVSSIPTFLYIPAKGQPQMDKGYKDKATFEKIIKEILLAE